MTWKFYDEEKPKEDGFYYVITFMDQGEPSLVTPYILDFDEAVGFVDADGQVGGEEYILAWSEIDYPKMPSIDELKNHGLVDLLLRTVEVCDR